MIANPHQQRRYLLHSDQHQPNSSISSIAVCFVLVNVSLHSSISGIAVCFVLINISLNSSISSVAVCFVLIDVSLHGCVSSVAVCFVLIDVRLHSSISSIAICLILINVRLQSIIRCSASSSFVSNRLLISSDALSQRYISTLEGGDVIVVAVNLRLQITVSSIAVCFILINVSLQSSISCVYVWNRCDWRTLIVNDSINGQITAHCGVSIYI